MQNTIPIDIAAYNLEGLTLKKGWVVKQRLQKLPGQSGSTFSVQYLVEKDGETCFMKAFDFGTFLAMCPQNPDGTDQDQSVAFENMLNAYKYEKQLSQHCKDKYVTKVSFVKDFSEETIPGNYNVRWVPCLIFELASQGDVRKVLSFSEKLDDAWKFKSLHDIAVGLKQLHAIDVSHQDLKPSNILVFKNDESKLCDLGRSVCNDIEGPYSRMSFTGDKTYTPPEIWYKFSNSDWHKRAFAIDCYMLGSMIMFYFTNVTMSAMLTKHIHPQFHWLNWNGNYEELIPYLEKAFAEALDEFEESIKDSVFKQELRKMVEQLCNPFPDKRGHIVNLQQGKNVYSMERFISTLDLLKNKAEIHLRKF